MNSDILDIDFDEINSIKIKLKTEQDLMATWKGDVTKPLVSVVCHTFNQVNYIRSALNGFLIQETDFPFEIILHDDCSTDGTTEIVEEYAKKYPNLIIPIIQKENKYSKDIDILSITLPKAKGHYISFCEGDDFWIHPKKIYYQYSEMERNKEVYICFHSSLELNENTKERKIVSQYSNDTCFISAKKIISDRGGSMPSASLFFKNKNIDEMLMSYELAPIGDFFIQSYMALKGKVLFLPEPMCIYRRNTTGSWTSAQQDKTKQSLYYKEMIKAIDKFYGNVKNLEHSHNLIIPLVFYLKVYLLQDRKSISILKNYYELVLSLENFKKSEVTQLLVKELKSILLKKTKYILSKRRYQHEL